MCGIAGILTRRDNLELAPMLQAMRSALVHRGPDDQGVAEVALPEGLRLGLAHTRLAILDLSPAGHQPMTDVVSGSWIVYNGEVYNHGAIRKELTACSFAGSSDTETILKGWAAQGETILSQLRGMFAFALYDGQRRQFWLVRDRLGVKPLYVCAVGNDTWLFASEVRALVASGLVPRRLDASAVDAYLALGAVPAPWTLLAGVTSLFPGETWRFDLTQSAWHNPQRHRYWRPPFAGDSQVQDRQAALAELRPVLEHAVSLRMLSDVPVGVFLSGGIDSSAIVATLARQGHRLRTFSVVFGEQSFDESQHSRRVAREFGTEHTELLLKPAQVLAEWDQALAAYDQPSIDGINTYFIAQATRQAGIKVALSGLGGDELFAGYSYFRLLARLDRPWQRGLARLAYRLLKLVSPGTMQTYKLGELLSGNGSRLHNYLVCRLLMAAPRRRLLLRGEDRPDCFLPAALAAELEADSSGLDAVNAHSLLELALYLANMLLRDTDQMSMAHALEVREPLLDHVLVETVARLAGPLKLAPGQQSRTKGLLVDALPTPLPRAILNRPKKGFVFPWEDWLRNELKGQVERTLTNPDLIEAAGLNSANVRQLWYDYLARRPGIRYTDVLALLHLVRWVQRHGLHMECGAAMRTANPLVGNNLSPQP